MRELAAISVLGGLLLTSTPGSFGQAAPTSFTVEEYANAVHQYLRGDFIRAGHELYGVRLEEVQQASDDYRRGWLTDSQLKAAALLHTQLAFLSDELESFHLETARVLLGQIRDDSRRQSFLKRWYLVVGYHYHSELRLTDADLVFETANQSFPDDTDLLLARGSLMECSAWMLGDESVLGFAQMAFDHLILKDPNHAEARLRLGHISLLRGQMLKKEVNRPEKSPKSRMHEGAYREINWVLKHTDDPELAFIANLLLGDIYKDRGQLTGAIVSYGAAAEIDPSCQAAAVALSLALRLNRENEASRGVMRYFLYKAANNPVEHDGWWRFLLGRSLLFESILRQMQKEMRR